MVPLFTLQWPPGLARLLSGLPASWISCSRGRLTLEGSNRVAHVSDFIHTGPSWTPGFLSGVCNLRLTRPEQRLSSGTIRGGCTVWLGAWLLRVSLLILLIPSCCGPTAHLLVWPWALAERTSIC